MFIRLMDTLIYIYNHNGRESFQAERPEAARLGESRLLYHH